MVFSLFLKFENNTTQIPEFWPNSGIWRSKYTLISDLPPGLFSQQKRPTHYCFYLVTFFLAPFLKPWM